MSRLLAAAALFLVACSSGGRADEPLGQATEPVIGGKASPDADDGVLILRTDRVKDTSVCSASLIAPNLLLTARHCIVAEYPADNIRCKSDGTLMAPSGGQLGESSPPENIHIFAGKEPEHDASSNLPGGTPAAIATQVITTDWPSVCRDDIALLVLDRELELPVIPLALDYVVTKATQVSVLGYGLTELSAESDRWSARRRRDDVPVKYVDTLPSTFALGRSVCKGDSGGPALEAESGAIVGVYSLGFPGVTTADCSSENALNYYAQVNHYPDLLRQGFEAAGHPFPGDAPNGAGGAGGAGGEDGEAPVGGEPSAAGGADGEPTESPQAGEPASASGGCTLVGAGAAANGIATALFGLVALALRRRRVSR